MKQKSIFQTLKTLKNDKNKKIILIYTPTHRNLGDSAITLAELQFLKDNFKDRSIYEFTKSETSHYKRKINMLLNKDDVVVINGGGILGSIWKFDHNVLLNFIKAFKNQKVVVMPQTIYFSEKSTKLQEKFIKKTKICKNLTIFCRDHASFETLQKLKVDFKYDYVPDIVLYLQPKTKVERNNKVLLIFRKDREKVLKHQQVLKALDDLNIEYDLHDMKNTQKISKVNRAEVVQNKFDQFAGYKMVITDRLHGMIFACINGTPCIAFDNLSKKVTGVYQWLKDLKEIKAIQTEDFNEKLLKEFYNKNAFIYDNKFLLKDFEKIKNSIKN